VTKYQRYISGILLVHLFIKKYKNMEKENQEEFKVSGEEVVKKVRQIIKEGNVRSIIIKNEEGKEIIVVPLTLGAVGIVLAPVLAAVGAAAALLTNCTIVVIKK
jgi:hypothetical protein